MYLQNASKSAHPKNANNSCMAPIPASAEAPAPNRSTGGLSPTVRRIRRSFTSSANVRDTIGRFGPMAGRVQRARLTAFRRQRAGTPSHLATLADRLLTEQLGEKTR